MTAISLTYAISAPASVIAGLVWVHFITAKESA